MTNAMIFTDDLIGVGNHLFGNPETFDNPQSHGFTDKWTIGF